MMASIQITVWRLAKAFCILLLVCPDASLLARQKLVPDRTATALSSPANGRSGITLTGLNGSYITQGSPSALKISWFESGIDCRLRYSTRPGGSQPENYPELLPDIGSDGELLISTGLSDLPIGTYYCVLESASSSALHSIEFQFFVQPSTPIAMIGPEGATEIRGSPPVFSWQAITGVPYYFIVLSQGELEIETDPSTGEIETLRGVNFIWQAFTDQTTIRYGDTDLSGTWPDQNIPPLLPGETYNWLVFSAFAPDLRYVAWDLYPLSTTEFVVSRPELPTAPIWITPAANASLSGAELQFAWQPVEAATRYRLLIRETHEDANIGTGTILLWQTITPATEAVFRPQDFFSNTIYEAIVVAETPAAMSVSPAQRFTYESQTGTIEVESLDAQTAAILPYTRVQITRPNQVGSPYAYFTNKRAQLRLRVPAGDLQVLARQRGYHDTVKPVRVTPGDTTRVFVGMIAADKVAVGRIVQQDGRPVAFASVSSNSGNQSDADGNGQFTLNLDPADQQLTVAAAGYITESHSLLQPLQDVTFVGDLSLQQASAEISGSLLDLSGLAVSGVSFRLEGPAQTLELTRGNAGSYSFNLEPGNWTITPRYGAYYSSPPSYSLLLRNGATLQAPFIFFRAGLVSGSVFVDGNLTRGGTAQLISTSDDVILKTEIDIFGSYRFDAEPGTYTLSIFKPGFNPFETQVTLEQGKSVVVNANLQQLSIIWGAVRERESSLPLANAQILELPTANELAVTNANGMFAFPAEPGRSYLLDAQLRGFASAASQSATVAAGDSLRINFAMEAASSVLRGTVALNNSPVTGAQVRVLEENKTVLTDATGAYELTLDPGQYTLRVSAGCADEAEGNINLKLGETANLDFNLRGSMAVVEGRVYSEDGVPLPEANLLATANANVTARTDSSGFYRLCLDAGAWFLLVSRVGYETADTTFIVSAGDTLANFDFFLKDNFARLDGRTLSEQGNAVENVQIILSNAFQQEVTQSNREGFFAFERVIPGPTELRTRVDGFFAPPVNITLAGGESRSITITLAESNGFISGRVIDGFTQQGLDSALVAAQLQGSSAFYTAYSLAPDGAYRIDGLPAAPGQAYRVLVSKPGFAAAAARIDVAANSENIDFEMFASNGDIAGRVLSSGDGQPVAGARVRASRAGTPTREDSTDSEGQFRISRTVFSLEYILQIDHPLFESATYTAASPSENIDYTLERRLGFARGSVSLQDDDTPLPGARIIFNNIDGIGRTDTLVTDITGNFSGSLWPGEYLATATLPLHFATPPQIAVSVQVADTVQALSFSMQRQALSALEIKPPDGIIDDFSQVQFTVQATDSSGRLIQQVPGLRWSLDVGIDTARIGANGLLEVVPGYADSLQIIVEDTLTTVTDVLRLATFAAVDSNSALTVFGRGGQELFVAPGSFRGKTRLAFGTSQLTPVQRTETTFRVNDPLFRIFPENLFLPQPLRLQLPLTSTPGVEESYEILRWNRLLSRWENSGNPSETVGDRIFTDIRATGSYAVVARSEPLAILDLKLQPNPFSPDHSTAFNQSGMAVRFNLTSNQAALPLVTAKIYNLEGDLIAILATQRPVPKGEQHLIWNGRTLEGRIARNGRYLLHFVAEDGEDKQESMHSIVLIR